MRLSDETLRRLFLAVAIWNPWDPYRERFFSSHIDVVLARALLSLVCKIRDHLQSLAIPEDTDPNPHAARFHRLLRSRFRRLFAQYCQESEDIVDILPEDYFVKNVVLKHTNPYITYPMSSVWWATVGHESSKPAGDVALKVPRSWEMPEGGLAGIKALLWWNLKHPNITPMYGITPIGDPLCDASIVTKWMERGTTRKVLRNSEYLSNQERTKLIYGWLLHVAKGLEYLHGEEISHGDVRGANILVDDDGTARLTDFGLSLMIDGTGGKYGTREGGNWRWLAPEQIHSGERHTKAGDIFSFASTCLELYMGVDPWRALPRKKQPSGELILLDWYRRKPKMKLHPHPWYNGELMRRHLWKFVKVCWSFKPADRPTAGEVVEKMIEVCNKIEAFQSFSTVPGTLDPPPPISELGTCP